LALERLEDRMAPAVITVNTLADDRTPNDGSVSLREAITAMNASNDLGDPDIIAQNPGAFGSGDTIQFAVTGTITLGSALPPLSRALSISGPGAGKLAISGNHASGVFQMDSGVQVILTGLSITAGTFSGGTGGGIDNLGT
jgi:CSLREA domain-containing protein